MVNLTPRSYTPRLPIVQVGGMDSAPGCSGTKKRKFYSPTPKRPTCSESLYRPRYPCPRQYEAPRIFMANGSWWRKAKKLAMYSRVCYNERFYNERMLQRTAFIIKIRLPQRTQMLQRTRRGTIGRRSTRVLMTCRALLFWLERYSSSLLWFVRFSYQFSSVICLFAPWVVKIFF